MERLIPLIVDMQYDFVSNTGSLYVEGAERAALQIASLLADPRVNSAIFTADWHPYNHISFEEYGGQWPSHCVQFTKGACIYESLLAIAKRYCDTYQVIPKGTLRTIERYSAIIDVEITGNNNFYLYDSDNDCTFVGKDDTLVLCGVAGDVCVLNTLKSLEPMWSNVAVYLSGTASLDKGTALNTFITEHNIKVFSLC